MPLDDRNSPKLLFIQVEAFGELFNSMYMAMGRNFRTVFAMREPLFKLNQQIMPGKSYRYEKLSDLLEIIEAEKPQMVCLFSGYLFVSEGIMSFEELDRLVEELFRRGIKVITSDPFLGLSARVPLFDPHNPFEQLLAAPLRLFGEMVFGERFDYFSKVTSSLKRVPHIYIVNPKEQGDIKRLAFFNPHIRRYVSELDHSANGGARAYISGQAYWLFILAGSDYWPDSSGISTFHNLLAQKLLETIEAGRRPVLIAPKACVEAMAANATLLRDTVFITNCDYNHYMSLLVGAEYAFYWNIFSASIVARMLNSGPTFFFARGHLADSNQQMFDKGMSCYYANAKLTYLDQTSRLDHKELASRAALQPEEIFKPIFENMRHLPTPDDIIRQLLEDKV